MHLIDTSAVAEIILGDSDSERTQRLLENLESEGLCLTMWTHVELASALSRRVRTGAMSTVAAEAARALYRRDFVASATLLPIPAAAYQQAESWVSHASLGLRTGDAMQLAAARLNGINSIVTLDKPLRTIAATLGFKTPIP